QEPNTTMFAYRPLPWLIDLVGGGPRLRCFFFSSRRRHTRLVSDWSSDVCSSDLLRGPTARRATKVLSSASSTTGCGSSARMAAKIGRASCRERGKVSGVVVLLKKKVREGGGHWGGAADRGVGRRETVKRKVGGVR